MTDVEQQVSSAAIAQIRVARPTDKLDEIVSFYHGGLGLPIIAQFANHEGYTGVMIGLPGEQFHLEFTHFEKGSPSPAPSRDNLLVLYPSEENVFVRMVQRMKEHGHEPVEPENPYWRGKSLTFEDPDGWRVVLYRGKAFQN
jgi:catechol 2,3-dioxygenase-like lactoylglutathione lyase family enzyme